MITEKLLELAESLKQKISKQDLLDNINTCFSYLNIQMESSISITMGDKSVSQIEALNNKRNYAHDKMCEAMNNINLMAKEKGMKKIFDFDLEPVQKNGRFVGYSQDNHYKTAGFCAIMADEMLYLGRETYKTIDQIERLEQEITEKVERRLIEKLSLESLIEKLKEFEEKHFSLDTIMNLESDMAYEITFRDKSGSFTVIPIDEYSVEIQDAKLPKDSQICDFLSYLGDGEIPKSILKEEILTHDGYNITGYYELEKEKEVDKNISLVNTKEVREMIERAKIGYKSIGKEEMELER